MVKEALAERVALYADFFEGLTPKKLDDLGEHFDADARFKDPFNDVRGLGAIREVFQDMYHRCADARFHVRNCAMTGRTAYFYWHFDFRLRRWQREKWRRIEGVSRATFNAEGKVTEHVDYWDAAEQVYDPIPLLGHMLRFVKRRLSA